MIVISVSRLGRGVKVPVPHADIASQSRGLHSKVPDLCPAGRRSRQARLKHFNPMWTFPDYCYLSELGADDIRYGPLGIQSIIQIVPKMHWSVNHPLLYPSHAICFKHSVIVYSRIVLPSTDVKGETKGKTYCPSTWNYAYQWEYAAKYADQLRQAGASSLLCQECILSVTAQLSNKSS